MRRSYPPGATSRRALLQLAGIRKVRRWLVILAGVIAVVVATILFYPRGKPPAPNPGPLPEYVDKLETTAFKLPGGVPLEMVRIGAGSFQMGSPESEADRFDCEGPVHTVNIKYDFCMGRYEVTQAQWLAVMGRWPVRVSPWRRIMAKVKRQPIANEPNPKYGKGPNHPAYFISWSDCQAFIEGLNRHIKKTGQGPATFRLPSEAEWEYACRAGTRTRFYFGDSLEGLDEDDLFIEGLAGVLGGKRSDYMK
ncbi:MAG: formylglycine-generating enzyme family protein, partial [Planctomycetota bacterium]